MDEVVAIVGVMCRRRRAGVVVGNGIGDRVEMEMGDGDGVWVEVEGFLQFQPGEISIFSTPGTIFPLTAWTWLPEQEDANSFSHHSIWLFNFEPCPLQLCPPKLK